jgi:hypothetical protein
MVVVVTVDESIVCRQYTMDKATEIHFNRPQHGWVQFTEPSGTLWWIKEDRIISINGYTPPSI